MIELKVDKAFLKNVDQFFHSLTEIEERKVLISAYKKGVKPMVATAKNIAPFKTGRLYNSIAAEAVPGRPAIMFGIKYGRGWAGWYGQWQNDGWRPTGPKGKGRMRDIDKNAMQLNYFGRKMIPAKNFIKHAFEWNEDDFLNISEREIEKYINQQITKYTQPK